MAPPLFRRCMICRRLSHRQEFIRLLKESASGAVRLDGGMGRSVYLCDQPHCLKEALRKNRLGKGLRAPVPDEVMAFLQQRLNDRLENTSAQTDSFCPRESDRS